MRGRNGYNGWGDVGGHRVSIKTNHLATNKIHPALHHFPAFIQVLGAVVGGAHLGALGVRQLALYHVRVETIFVQRGRAQHTETARRGGTLIVA